MKREGAGGVAGDEDEAVRAGALDGRRGEAGLRARSAARAHARGPGEDETPRREGAREERIRRRGPGGRPARRRARDLPSGGRREAEADSPCPSLDGSRGGQAKSTTSGAWSLVPNSRYTRAAVAVCARPALASTKSMRQPMLRSRSWRHGAQYVNRFSLSGSRARPTSARPSATSLARRSLSSGRCPIAFALRSFGWTSRSVGATFRSPQTRRDVPDGVRRAGPASHRLEERELGGEVLAAVRDVDGRGGEPLRRGLDDARLVVELRVRERHGGPERLRLQEEADARVPLVAVPVRRVARGRRERDRHLLRRGLQLLQADDVWRVRVEELEDLQLARADPVHVPRDDLHENISAKRRARAGAAPSSSCLKKTYASSQPAPRTLLRPGREVGLGVVLAPQAEVTPGRGRLEGRRPLLVVGDAERRARRFQERVDLRVHPGRVAELERGLRVGTGGARGTPRGAGRPS